MKNDFISRRDVQNILSKYYPDAGPTTEQILHNINRDVKNVPDADVVTWGQLKKAWAIATADVAPVVHGRWIEDGYNHYKAVCFECGEPCGTYVMNNPRDRFCKWCGAKMDGGADDD